MTLKIASNDDASESSTFAELTDSECSKETPREPRHVTFLVNTGPVTAILETDPMSEEEARAYYMQPEDFSRCDEDIKRTVRKWLKHIRENEPFDHEYCTVRGAEPLVEHMQRKAGLNNDTKIGAEIKLQHLQDVLKEIKLQKSLSKKQPLNDEKIRRASLRSASESLCRAIELAEQDEAELRKIHPRWSAMHPRGPKRRPLVLMQVQVQVDDAEAKIKSLVKKEFKKRKYAWLFLAEEELNSTFRLCTGDITVPDFDKQTNDQTYT
jgi:hypothetical protein